MDSSIHCINWNSYHYYGMMDDERMTQEEKFVWNSYQRRVQIGFSGTLVKHNETMTIPKFITLVENSQQVGNSMTNNYLVGLIEKTVGGIL